MIISAEVAVKENFLPSRWIFPNRSLDLLILVIYHFRRNSIFSLYGNENDRAIKSYEKWKEGITQFSSKAWNLFRMFTGGAESEKINILKLFKA